MSPERLLQNFDRLIDTPDAVPRLQRFILDLAVRGKLVEQNPEDEPAAKMLKRINKWMAEAIQKKFIRAPRKPLKEIDQNEEPFTLPNGWVWARLGEVIYIQSGDGLTAEKMKDGDIPVYGGNGVNGYHNTFNIEEPTIVIGRVGYYCGSIHITPERAWVTDNAFITKFCSQEIALEYLVLLLTGTNLKEDEKATAQPVISGSKIYPVVIGLPPLPEQHRIVAKVDELMALCDELEAAQTKRERRRDRLVAATLHGLNNGETDLEAKEKFPFEESARFYFNHLPRLTTRPEHIQLLRQTILNLAVRGKLVPQDPSDEPASKVDSLNVPFRLPSSWQWKSVGELGKTQTGSTPPTGERHHYNGNIPFIKPAAISDGVINYEGQGLTESGVRESAVVQAGAILMVCIGGSIGKAAVVNQKACFNQQINSVSPREGIDTQYLFIAMQSPYFRTLVVNTAAQGTLPIISKGKWERLLIPLPPLAEQYRIVEKVAELMTLCDELETRIDTISITRRKLLETTLCEAIAA